ncbi:inorganic diphosphatase [Candidatus Woesearchaeota archaeon]|nr:inorganic diphosphatase [Candidatus Woesearchaeota archaeon]
MTNLHHDVPPGTENEMNMIVEIPAGSRNKYEYNKEHGLFFIDRVVPEPLVYPATYGFIPQTLCDDGDAVDVVLIMRESAFQGSLVKVRPVGMLIMNDSGEVDNKIIAVPCDDKYFDHIKELKDVSPHFLKELSYFMEHYKDMKGAKVVANKYVGIKEAKEEFHTGIATYKKSKGKK